MTPYVLSLPASPAQLGQSVRQLWVKQLPPTIYYGENAAETSSSSSKCSQHQAINLQAFHLQRNTLPVTVSGASVLLPRWINLAAKLFSSNEVPFTTGASSKGFTD